MPGDLARGKEKVKVPICPGIWPAGMRMEGTQHARGVSPREGEQEGLWLLASGLWLHTPSSVPLVLASAPSSWPLVRVLSLGLSEPSRSSNSGPST